MLLVAIGNRWRRDDGVAFFVASRLKEEAPLAATILETGDVLSILEQFPSHDCVVVVDAVRSSKAPGTVHVLDAGVAPLPADWTFASSHQVGLAHAVEIARALGLMPRRLMVVGIEGEEFGYGMGLTPAVGAAVSSAAGIVRECLAGAAAAVRR